MIRLGEEVQDINLASTKIVKSYLGSAIIFEKDEGVVYITKSAARKSVGNMYIPFDLSLIDNFVIHNEEVIKYIIIGDRYKVYKKDFTIGYGSFILNEGVDVVNVEVSQGTEIKVVCKKF